MDTVQFLLKIYTTIKIAKSSTRKQQDKYLHASATESINKYTATFYTYFCDLALQMNLGYFYIYVVIYLYINLIFLLLWYIVLELWQHLQLNIHFKIKEITFSLIN